jgi:hypothetical protein
VILNLFDGDCVNESEAYTPCDHIQPTNHRFNPDSLGDSWFGTGAGTNFVQIGAELDTNSPLVPTMILFHNHQTRL